MWREKEKEKKKEYRRLYSLLTILSSLCLYSAPCLVWRLLFFWRRRGIPRSKIPSDTTPTVDFLVQVGALEQQNAYPRHYVLTPTTSCIPSFLNSTMIGPKKEKKKRPSPFPWQGLNISNKHFHQVLSRLMLLSTHLHSRFEKYSLGTTYSGCYYAKVQTLPALEWTSTAGSAIWLVTWGHRH